MCRRVRLEKRLKKVYLKNISILFIKINKKLLWVKLKAIFESLFMTNWWHRPKCFVIYGKNIIST